MKERWPARLGVAALAIALVGIACSTNPPQPTQNDASASGVEGVTLRRFSGDVYGASGIVQLPDGRALVAGDDQHNPLAIVDLNGSGAVQGFTRRQVTRALTSSDAPTNELNDLEALTIDPRGHVYAITSHGLTTKAVEKPDREQLLRFDIHGDRLEDVRVYTGLKRALVALDPSIETAAALTPAGGGLNIEGLAWDPVHSRLLIGLRSPRKQGDALAVWLQNPDDIFERHQEAVLLAPVRLGFGGEGVRDVTYSPTLKAFVILAGPWRHRASKTPTVWSWSGGDESPVELQAPEVEDLKPEGVAEIVINGKPALVVVSDDGNGDDLYARGRALRNSAVASRYVILPFDRLVPIR